MKYPSFLVMSIVSVLLLAFLIFSLVKLYHIEGSTIIALGAVVSAFYFLGRLSRMKEHLDLNRATLDMNRKILNSNTELLIRNDELMTENSELKLQQHEAPTN